MSTNLSTFNIFWYGSADITKNACSEADHDRIAAVLARLDAHAFVFQEILDHERLETLLHAIPGHDYQLRQPDGAWLTSAGADPPAGQMKIVCAYDAKVLKLEGATVLCNPVKDPKYRYRRDPYAMHLRELTTGADFTLVGVHLKSGPPNAGPSDKDVAIRCRETSFLASWMDGTTDLDIEPTKNVIVMGDYNAAETDCSLAPLYEGRELLQSRFAASFDPADPLPLDDPDEKWSTFLDGVVIDHAIVSPTIRPRIGSALIYAFDLDPALDEEPAGGGHWLRRTTDYRVEPYESADVRPVPNLYRISDHRPVRITLDLV